MATDLEARKATSKSEAFVERQLAELCSRIRRVDVVCCLLTLAVLVLAYACGMAVFDRLVGSASWAAIVRWGAYGVFVAGCVYVLLWTVRVAFRRVNPYYVAHQLEQALPDGKNSIINWLDLHTEDLPGAFRRNLSMNAAEQLKGSDLDEPLATRKNWLLVSAMTVLLLGLVILLILGPAQFGASMQRAFLPFLDTGAPLTRIEIVEPVEGDAEVAADQPVRFAARIEGRIPAAHRADAPRLHYQYQLGEDYRTQPLLADGAGMFRAELAPAQVRSGFRYYLSAGDAATVEHQVRVRAQAHVRTFEITYHHRPYRKLDKTAVTFPNKDARAPIIHGQRGAEVELVVHPSRPADQVSIEMAADKTKTMTLSKRDTQTFATRFVLDQPGRFRVLFTLVDGEENLDRDWYDIIVTEDEAPHVGLTSPARDVSVPANGTLELEGRASDDIGVKSMTLHLRTLNGPTIKLQPKVYRAGKSWQLADGTYPDAIEYRDFLALDELLDARGIKTELPAGAQLEYWLEATDNADHPDPNGNTGKSTPYKLTLTPPIKDAKQQQTQRKKAQDVRARHDKQQDTHLASAGNNQKQDRNGNAGGPEEQAGNLKNDKKDNGTKQKLDKALDDQNKDGGGGQNQGEKKPGGPDKQEGPMPKSKDDKPMMPGDTGNSKDGDGAKSESRDGGDSAGDSKPGPKESAEPAKSSGPTGEPAGGAKDAGPMNADAPPPSSAKEAGMGAPAPGAKGEGAGPQGSAKKEPARKDGESALDELAKLLRKLPQKGPEADKAGEAIAQLAKKAGDENVRDLARDILQKNGRDPATGKETKKGPNLYGSQGKSDGISDDIKADAANREFARRIGAMQLDHWKKRITPDLLKKAGVSDADWLRFVKNQQAHDALVRQLNAKHAMAQARATRPATGLAPRLLESPAPSESSPDAGRYQPPPELRDPERRFRTKPP